MPARGVAAAPEHGLARRQPPPGDALLVLAARLPVPPPWRRPLPCAGRRASRARDLRERLLRLGASFRRGGRARRRSAHGCATSRRELAVEELYRLPDEGDRSTTTLEDGELLLEVELPPVEASVYLKAMDRKRWSFPQVGRRGRADAAARRGSRWPAWRRSRGESRASRRWTRRRRCRGRSGRCRSRRRSSAARSHSSRDRRGGSRRGRLVPLRDGAREAGRAAAEGARGLAGELRRRDRGRERRPRAAGGERRLPRLGARPGRLASLRPGGASAACGGRRRRPCRRPRPRPACRSTVSSSDWQTNGGEAVAASYGGVRLHPVLLPRAVWDAVPDEGARSLPARLVPCDDLRAPGDVDFASRAGS